ncbi:MAG: dUTP diphosphatase [Eubacteriales bacterium]|nr:dUTP diphosphatase [Eubacteriales bacterium]
MKKDECLVGIELCHPAAKRPAYQHSGDAGMDIYAVEEVVIAPGETCLLHTGLKFRIPSGYELEIRPRSGLSVNTRLRIPNAPGTIDSGYRDELMIPLYNASAELERPFEVYDLSTKQSPWGAYRVRPGERIAQMLLKRVETMCFVDVAELDRCESFESVEDRAGGFGSTGLE